MVIRSEAPSNPAVAVDGIVKRLEALANAKRSHSKLVIDPDSKLVIDPDSKPTDPRADLILKANRRKYLDMIKGEGDAT